MQTEEDRKIQNSLEQAGKGLSAVEALFMKYMAFPVFKRLLSWERAMAMFEREGLRILNDARRLDNDRLFRKKLIPRIMGIEDNSRYYSPAMVLWHLIYVGQAIQEGVVTLSKNEKPDFVVRIANFKPFIEISHTIVDDYAAFLENYRPTIEKHVVDKYARNYHAHPWFGPLNPHQWLVLSAIHQGVHGRQLREILRAASP